MTLTVSVVTPSYNQGRFIERTIESVLAQDGEVSDYIVMDGGSTDQTVSILEKYGSRLRWVSEKDKGQTDAVNKGICATSGDIIGWLNSDDVYYPGILKAVREFFEARPDVDLLYGNANHIDVDDHIIERYPAQPWDFERLKETCFICQPATFFRRSVVERYGLLDESLHYCMDYEYWLRLARAGAKIAYLPQVLAGSRLYAETKTLGARPAVHREINAMMKHTFGKVPDSWLFAYAHTVMDRKGIPRTQSLSFVLPLGIIAIYAAFRWNKMLSMSMLRTMVRWTTGARSKFCRGRSG